MVGVSAFGVEHADFSKALSDRDRTAGLGLGAVGLGTGAVAADRAGKDLRRTILPHRGAGVLMGALKGDPDKVEHHIRGARRDLKTLVALKHGKTAATVGAAGLGGLTALEAIRTRHRPAPPPIAARTPAPGELTPEQARLRAVPERRSR